MSYMGPPYYNWRISLIGDHVMYEMSLDGAKWHVTLSLPKSHAPCYHHMLLAWLMLCLHPSVERAKDSRPKIANWARPNCSKSVLDYFIGSKA